MPFEYDMVDMTSYSDEDAKRRVSEFMDLVADRRTDGK